MVEKGKENEMSIMLRSSMFILEKKKFSAPRGNCLKTLSRSELLQDKNDPT